MATQSQPKRRGPLSKEEMIDLRNEQLRLDEELVRSLVEEAKYDFGDGLLEPIQAVANPLAVLRHRRRFVRVMGDVARFKSNGKMTLLAVGITILLFLGLYFNPEHPWWVDGFFALVFGAVSTFVALVHTGYKLAFSRVYALERRDFTDPSYVTGWVRVYLSSLAFYYRPEVWRGNDGHNGVNNPDSFVVLACGEDRIDWTYDREAAYDLESELWQQEEWCRVEPGPLIKDFRTPLDYYGLPADRYTTDGISIKHRRVWCRELLRNGAAHGAWEKGVMSFMEGRWPWLLNAAMLLAGSVILLVALG